MWWFDLCGDAEMSWMGVVVNLVLVVAAVLSGSDGYAFINVPSIIVTYVMGHLVLWSVFGADAFHVLKADFAENQPERGARIAAAAGRFYILAGWVGVLIGAIQMGHGLTDMASFGPATGVLLLTVFYAYATHLLIWAPLETHMLEKVAAKG